MYSKTGEFMLDSLSYFFENNCFKLGLCILNIFI